MNPDRRRFLRNVGLASAGVVGASILPLRGQSSGPSAAHGGTQHFNMCGYGAPPLERVRIAILGLGMRGSQALRRLRHIEQVDVVALCDVRQEQLDKALAQLGASGPRPDVYSGSEDAWRRACDRDDVDLVYICTPWALHAPMAVYAMEQGKHAAVEVPAAQSIEECWQLVETSERTRRHCMMLENCCYDFFELLTLSLARAGFFGEIVHCEGAYIHNLIDLNFNRTGYDRMWRLEENSRRNGNLYPTHGLGPIAQVMNVNRGDRFDFLVSVSTADFSMNVHAKELAEKDPFFAAYVDRPYRGNMNTTTIRTHHGRTIMLQHDVSSPRPYSRIHLISGTRAMARKWPRPGRISVGENWLDETEMKALEEQHTPELVRRVGDLAKQIGGHGGMDFIMDWRLIDCLRNGRPLDQDVYDAASWSAIGMLSEQSVAARSSAVDVPDFTRGAWQQNAPVNLSLDGVGTTRVRGA